MYVTIFRYRVKAGMEQALKDHNNEWKRTIQPELRGFISVQVFKSRLDPLEWTHVATFVDRYAEMENANHLGHRMWYRHMLEMLEQPPKVWEGELIQEG